MSFPERVAHWFARIVVVQINDALSEQRGEAEAFAKSTRGLSAAVGGASSSLKALEDAIEARRPFSGTTTVHQAWARHPSVRGVFAGYHLTACPDCPVGADETLEEAARGYQIPLTELLSQLNALL